MALSLAILSVCREYFGTHKTLRGKNQLVDNRCDACPLRAPCLKFGSTPTPTMDALDESRRVFEAEANEILNARTAKEAK